MANCKVDLINKKLICSFPGQNWVVRGGCKPIFAKKKKKKKKWGAVLAIYPSYEGSAKANSRGKLSDCQSDRRDLTTRTPIAKY